MKKRWLIVLTVLALALTGCGKKDKTPAPAASSETTRNQVTTQPLPEQKLPTAEDLGRAEQTDLTVMVEGMEEAVPSTLYIGDGFSLYIPDEGWEKDWASGWRSTANDQVTLRVETHTGQSPAEVLAAMDKDYAMGPLEGDRAAGTNGEGWMVDIRFVTGPGQRTYTVILEYPPEAAEGFGVRLAAIAATVEANDYTSTAA